MNENELKNLLNKYIQKRLTEDERRTLFSVVSSPENEKLIKGTLSFLMEDFNGDLSNSKNTDFDKIFKKILFEIKLSDRQIISDNSNNNKKSRKIILQSISVAASLIITFSLGNYYAFKKMSSNESKFRGITYTEVRAPYGSTSQVILPDGSEVTLNAGSTLKYRNDFNSDNRDLTLKGEAYFKVAKNTEIPLIVNAGNINIKAVGTEFNIRAYDNDGIIETTLVEGKVEITQIGKDNGEDKFVDLVPNQKAIYIKETESISLEKIENIDPSLPPPSKTIYDNILISPRVDVTQVAAWTHGKLVIRGENLENISIELQRKYDVTFVFTDDIAKQFSFNGILLDETLEQVLNVIKLTAPIEYALTGKTVYIGSDISKLNDFSKYLK